MKTDEKKVPHKNKETLSAREWMTGVRIYLQVKLGKDTDPNDMKGHSSKTAKKAYDNGYTYDYYGDWLIGKNNGS